MLAWGGCQEDSFDPSARQGFLKASDFDTKMVRMHSRSRRRFMQQAATAGLTGTDAFAFKGVALSQTRPATATGPVRVFVDPRRTISSLDRNVFGSFLEHLGRAIYEGVYEVLPLSSPTAMDCTKM